MSNRARAHDYRADSGRVVGHGGARHRNAAGGYTLGHAGRQFRLGPVTFWIVVGSLVIMGGWSLATGTYFAFHDDVLSRLIARHTEQRFDDARSIHGASVGDRRLSCAYATDCGLARRVGVDGRHPARRALLREKVTAASPIIASVA